MRTRNSQTKSQAPGSHFEPQESSSPEHRKDATTPAVLRVADDFSRLRAKEETDASSSETQDRQIGVIVKHEPSMEDAASAEGSQASSSEDAGAEDLSAPSEYYHDTIDRIMKSFCMTLEAKIDLLKDGKVRSVAKGGKETGSHPLLAGATKSSTEKPATKVFFRKRSKKTRSLQGWAQPRDRPAPAAPAAPSGPPRSSQQQPQPQQALYSAAAPALASVFPPTPALLASKPSRYTPSPEARRGGSPLPPPPPAFFSAPPALPLAESLRAPAPSGARPPTSVVALRGTAQPSEPQPEAALVAPRPGSAFGTARSRLRFNDGGMRHRSIYRGATAASSQSIVGHEEEDDDEDEEEEDDADGDDNVEFDLPLASGSDLLNVDPDMSEGLVVTSDALDDLASVFSIPEPSPPVQVQRTAPELLLRQASETEEYKPARKPKRGPEAETQHPIPLPVAQLHEADGDGRRKKHKAVPPSNTVGGGDSGKFACPYFKRNPKKYREWTSCPGPGWDEVHRVKTHLYRRHPLPIQCPRCWDVFKVDTQLQTHLQQDPPCSVQRNQMLQEGFTKEQEKRLRSRKKTHADMTGEDKWREIYTILFPDDNPSVIPSPYYIESEDGSEYPGSSSTELEDYATFIRREMPTLVRRELETLFQNEFQDVEERLRPRIADIVLNLQPKLLGLYKQSQMPLSEYGPEQQHTGTSGSEISSTPQLSQGSGPKASGRDSTPETVFGPDDPGNNFDAWNLYPENQPQPQFDMNSTGPGLDWDFDAESLPNLPQ
ncbi:uncharacterized protein C8A04DRAFT_32922 [Dichotomopilus funicola]|uniref:C2H2-type domain-containing protein n=1 Tax=Dichotomopilus funicola TaxID=1934379 RepID=A0AAN6ZHQ3_9PEZI|nr:hypothetical protein C8A04DRAFT_32922 [Dichotomopilus funicola]